MLDRTTLRPSALLLAGGFLTYVVVTLLHTAGPANDHHAIFDHYAHSHSWTLVHLGQFAGMALITAGLLALVSALHPAVDGRRDGAAWVARLGAVAATVAFGLYGVLQAVDGVALKQAVDAWATAAPEDKAARFADAETLRWLEWGTRSYQNVTFGLALVLLGIAVARTARLPRALGVVMGLSGVAYVVQGWVLGSDGFADANTSAILAGYVLMLAWIGWLAVAAWRPTSTRHRAVRAGSDDSAPADH